MSKNRTPRVVEKKGEMNGTPLRERASSSIKFYNPRHNKKQSHTRTRFSSITYTAPPSILLISHKRLSLLGQWLDEGLSGKGRNMVGGGKEFLVE